MIILKATEVIWNLISPGDWEKRKWKVEDTGWYSYITTYRANDDLFDVEPVTVEGSLQVPQMDKLKKLLTVEWAEETGENDGTAWEFKAYENGECVKHRDTSPVAGVEPFEDIVSILRSAEEQE